MTQNEINEMPLDQKPRDNFEVFLVRQLRNSTPYIDDAGFSDTVLGALPQPPKRPRWLIGLASLITIVMSAFALFPLGVAAAAWAYTFDIASLIQLGLTLSVVSLGAVLVWLSQELNWI
jgi:hypothetical protein